MSSENLVGSVKEVRGVKKALKEIRFYLVEFKIIFIALIIWNAFWIYHMVMWFEANHHLLSIEGTAAYISIIMALLANMKWAMEKSID